MRGHECDESKKTVLKTDFNEELAKEYGVEGMSSCHFKVGQEFICDRAARNSWLMQKNTQPCCLCQGQL